MPHDSDTIFALSSGRLPAAIAVIRISGPHARDALQALTGRVPEPRRAALVRVRDPQTDEILDEALALFFPGPNSETGEDTAELQLHGGRAVVAGVSEALARLPGFRPAEAGEFTRRAFENGRLDLTQVEGLSDLIYADTAAQRRQAFRHLKGLLGERAETWRSRLIEALALIEAGIDFSDEGDVPDDLTRPALQIARELHAEIAEALAGAARGERLRDGMVVAIAGPPNAGKSTLLNRLARREAAIVSPHAGTTRDVIEVHLDLDGYPVTLLDTAGIRDSDDPVEHEGVRRARARAAEADLVLWVVDATAMTDAGGADPNAGVPPDHAPDAAGPEVSERTDGTTRQITGWTAAPPLGTFAAALSGTPTSGLPPISVETWLVLNKIDLASCSVSTAGSALPSAGHLRAPSPSLDVSPSRRRTMTAEDRSAVSRYGDLTASPQINLTTSPGGNVPGSPQADVTTSSQTNVTRSPDASITASPDANGAVSSSSLPGPAPRLANESEFMFKRFSVSARNGSGVEELTSRLSQYCLAYFAAGEPALVTRTRHRLALEEVHAALARVIHDDFTEREDMLAEELRLASRALGRLTGRVDVEELLDVIFRDFCIGK